MITGRVVAGGLAIEAQVQQGVARWYCAGCRMCVYSGLVLPAGEHRICRARLEAIRARAEGHRQSCTSVVQFGAAR
jgi:hypothetical protein